MYDRRNRYLQDRAMHKSDMARGRGRDMRDYGRVDYRGMYDSRMDSRDYNSEYDSRRDYRDYRDYGNEDPNRNFKYNREHTRNDMYEMYGSGFITPTRDYRMDRRYDYADDYDNEEKEYKHHLHEWIEKLKQKDRIRTPKDQVIRQAKNMKVEFKDFDEDEFYAIYLMHISDYPEKSNDYNYYISMAKDWLEDDDVYYKGGDKVCSYLYHTVLGK